MLVDALIFSVWTFLLASIPGNVLPRNGESIYWQTNVYGSFPMSGNNRGNNRFNNLDHQLGLLGSMLQFGIDGDSRSGLSLRTKSKNRVNMVASRTDSSTSLATRPAIGKVTVSASPIVDGIVDGGPIKVNNGDSASKLFTNEDSGGELSTVGLISGHRLSSIHHPPVVRHQRGPVFDDIATTHGAKSFLSQIDVIPDLPPRTGESSIANAGKYQLVAECRNLAIRVIWNSGVMVESQAVGGYYNLILREIEHHNRPRNG
jgi:hypothetical protein